MHRFKISELGRNVFWLQGPERDHLVRVLRLSPGDEIIGFDNSGAEYKAVVNTVGDHSVTCGILEQDYPEVEARTQVYLVTGLSKGEKMEWVIQKGTELGMAGLIPLRTKRAVMKLEGNKAKDRVERWQKICGEAAKQSHRVRESKVYPVADWKELKDLLPPTTQWIIPYENEKSMTLRSVLKEFNPQEPIAILIGPEGGFEESEVLLAQNTLQAQSVSLGPRILRAETAAIATLTLVLGYYGDLG
ncbi:RNA methyltransferase, RsmE family [Desulfitobacterium dichloroeliminans LMG P-21439]|uniref:Ribosomal RNA small subunit methyltransferase E n=1 Tax=Desulfitobacterium dichloroeliminans (strain LMG P-21439 / DCA1) TaxID=871963 RepID=L0F9A3_DESDL|nr:RsmE family RNA methyltransferase [Desulfitobacterium dichloroeliminans]AGA70414.1 RNA methyltransferase, RsmE family [Desulfitobacterium dichloroeliminans LMG P-21439]